jgi:cellulose biosynthesis protein BcsQ
VLTKIELYANLFIREYQTLIIIPYMEKGGVGKTTITASLGYALASYGKVLLIDGDPQGDLTNQIFDVSEMKNCGKDYYYLLKKEKAFSDVVFEARPPKEAFQGLYVLGVYNTHKELKNYFEYQFQNDEMRIKFITKEAARNGFDYILFDLPASFDFYTKHTLILADQIVPVIQCEEFGVEKYALLRKDLKSLQENYEIEMKTDFPIANRIDKNKAIHREYLTILDDLPFKYFICSESNEITNAAANHKVIQEYRPKNSNTSVFNELAVSLVGSKECKQ